MANPFTSAMNPPTPRLNPRKERAKAALTDRLLKHKIGTAQGNALGQKIEDDAIEVLRKRKQDYKEPPLGRRGSDAA